MDGDKEKESTVTPSAQEGIGDAARASINGLIDELAKDLLEAEPFFGFNRSSVEAVRARWSRPKPRHHS